MSAYDIDIDWPRTLWIGFGVLLAATVAFVLYSFIGTFVFGVFLYYATRPLYRRVYRRVRQRSVAAGLSLFLLALPVIVLFYYTVAIAVQEFSQFAQTAEVGPYADAIEPYINVSEVVQSPQTLLSAAAGPDAVVGSLEQFVSYLGIVGTGLVHVFVMFAIAFYLLRDGPRFAEWAKRLLDRHGVVDQYFSEVDRSFHKVFYGNILNAIVTGAIGAIAFSLVDFVAPAGLSVPYPALTGLLAGAASLIPIVGMKIVYVPMALYLAVGAGLDGEGWWFVALFAAVAFVIVDTIPDLVVRPYVSGGGSLPFLGTQSDPNPQPGLHTGTLMVAYVLGPFLFGWYGLFLAPMILVLVVHFARVILPVIVEGERRPDSVDPTNLVGDDTGEPDVENAPDRSLNEDGTPTRGGEDPG